MSLTAKCVSPTSVLRSGTVRAKLLLMATMGGSRDMKATATHTHFNGVLVPGERARTFNGTRGADDMADGEARVLCRLD